MRFNPFLSLKWESKQEFWISGERSTKEGGNFRNGAENQPRMKRWYWGKEVLINKVLDSTYKDKIKKAREHIIPVVDTVTLFV